MSPEADRAPPPSPSLSLSPPPYLSVVIPVFNEAEVLERLFARLTAVLDWLGRPYEIIFTNDGSRDDLLDLLRDFQRRRPREGRVIDFNGNFGQHMAIMAAFERVRGEVVVTLDADLQKYPSCSRPWRPVTTSSEASAASGRMPPFGASHPGW